MGDGKKFEEEREDFVRRSQAEPSAMDSYLGRFHPAGSGRRELTGNQKLFLWVIAILIGLPLLVGLISVIAQQFG